MPAELRRARVRVPGSTSNLGAGFDCVGLAVDRHLTATFDPGGDELRLERAGTLAAFDHPPAHDLVCLTFRAALRRAGVRDTQGTIRVDSDVPVGRGLGSSGAAVVAGLLLAHGAGGNAEAPDRDALLGLAARAEGHPENVAAALYGGLVAVTRRVGGAPRVLRLPLAPAIAFVFAAPAVVVNTEAARQALPHVVAHAAAANAVQRMAALLRGLETADAELLRVGMDDELHVPHRLPLIPHAHEASAAALDAGAWAITISGSGSGLLAVGPHERATTICDALRSIFERVAGETAVFVCAPDPDGAVLST